ncbi:DUF202 domain-containing protein [Haloprofundus salilacus]|uniref:DUF202 domain-containing protein n=1 Tax=Haloprofundus salilacus TaxID=2876190 RepID=UPI001CCC8B4B|nr:DUF202 domain-containing protein [Haloprofundus salilacus]
MFDVCDETRFRVGVELSTMADFGTDPSDDASASATSHRDLAVERTRLARERTTLAHVRTGFSSFLFGVALYRLFVGDATDTLGLLFVGIGMFFLVTGGASYLSSRRRLRRVLSELEGR